MLTLNYFQSWVANGINHAKLLKKCTHDAHLSDSGYRGATGMEVRSCMVLPPLKLSKTKYSKRTVLHELYEQQRQSAWYDNIRRPVIDHLKSLIESGVRGVTCNPTIFQRAILSESTEYYVDQFSQMMQEGIGVEDAYWGMVVKDIQDACDSFQQVYQESRGEDGYVAVDVAPSLAHETDGIVEAAKWLNSFVNRPNVYIKIPATEANVPAIRDVISLGISVNVNLIFSIQRYEAVIDAYLDGLEAATGQSNFDLSKISSVASFYVSRVDTEIDNRLKEIGTMEALSLCGKAANAQAALAFKTYQRKFSGARWESLAKLGAKKQRLLWASTGVKNPAYDDTHYICPLIGPETVNTMPPKVLRAFLDHGTVSRTVDADLAEAQRVYNKIEELGIRWSDVGILLETNGVQSIQKSFNDVISSLVKLDLDLLFRKGR